MLQVFLGTDDDIICIDPTLEYFDIAEALGNQAAIINLSTYTKNLHQSFGDGRLGAGFKRFPGIYPG